MNTAQALILARQYVEAAFKVKTTSATLRHAIDSGCSIIGVQSEKKNYLVCVYHNTDLIIAYEQAIYSKISELQKIYPKPVVIMNDFYLRKTDVEILDCVGGGRFTARKCETGEIVCFMEYDIEIKHPKSEAKNSSAEK